jgi:hypothetical protein
MVVFIRACNAMFHSVLSCLVPNEHHPGPLTSRDFLFGLSNFREIPNLEEMHAVYRGQEFFLSTLPN